MAIHFWKWFTAKESLLAVEEAFIFRRQPALQAASRALRHSSHVPCWPHPRSLNHTVPQDDAQWPISSNSLTIQNPLWSKCPGLILCSGGNVQINLGGLQPYSPPVNVRSLASNQHMDTHFLWVFLKRAYDISFGRKKKVGRQATQGWEVTPTSKTKSIQRDHCLPATPNFNLVSQPLCN